MNTNQIKKISDFLSILMNFLMAYSFLLLLVFFQTKGYVSPFNQLFLVFMPILASFYRRRIHQIIGFFLIHIFTGTLLVLILSSNSTEQICFGLYCAVIMFFSLAAKISKKPVIRNLLPIAFYISIFFLIFIAAGAYQAEEVKRLTVFAFFVFILIYYICLYLDEFCNFIYHNQHSTNNMPIHRIFGQGSLQLFFFLCVSLFISFITSFLHLNTLLLQIKNALYNLFRWILLQFVTTVPPKSPGQNSKMPPSAEVSGALPEWLRILAIILSYGIFIITVVFILTSIASFLYKIYKKFYETKDKVLDKRERLSFHSKKESLLANRKKRNSVSFLKPKDNNEKIRKSFFITVKKNIQKETRKGAAYRTPSEFDYLFENADKKEALEQLSEYYEKARYSQDLCTKEEAAHAKELELSLRPRS